MGIRIPTPWALDTQGPQSCDMAANVVPFDSLDIRSGSPFRCERATTRGSSHPRRVWKGGELGWSDIAIGMLVPRLCSECSSARLLGCAFETWMAEPIDVLLLVDVKLSQRLADRPCTDGALDELPEAQAKRFAERPRTHWQCYSSPAQVGRNLWRKTDVLLRALVRSLPSKAFYVKIDLDTLVRPRPLLRLFRHLSAGLADGYAPRLYLGHAVPGAAFSRNSTLCLRSDCLFRSELWGRVSRFREPRANRSSSGLEPAPIWIRKRGPSAPRAALPGSPTPLGRSVRRSQPASSGTERGVRYAAGSMYSFSSAALRDVLGIPTGGGNAADGGCLVRAHAALLQWWAARGLKPGAFRVFEDELVGMCAYAHRIPLVSCPCFARDSPCDGGRPTLGHERFEPHKCHDGTPRARLCRLPLGAHRVKDASLYRSWWAFLEAREPGQEELLDGRDSVAA